MAEIGMEQLEDSVSSFVKNPYWKKFLEDAPTELCKSYIRLSYYLSKLFFSDHESTSEELKAVNKKMDICEKAFSIEDWMYLLKHDGNSPFAGKC